MWLTLAEGLKTSAMDTRTNGRKCLEFEGQNECSYEVKSDIREHVVTTALSVSSFLHFKMLQCSSASMVGRRVVVVVVC